MERKLKVAEFATILGVVPKTVYKMIERNEIITVNERVNNRQMTLIVTDDEQIEKFKSIYGKLPVSDGNCYNSVTDNDRLQPVSEQSHTVNESECMEKAFNNANFTNEVIDRIITLNNGYNEQLNTYNERLQRVNEELITAKSKMLLLEDKAGREGLYINEIKELKEGNKRLKWCVYTLITVSVLLLLTFTSYVTYQISTKPTVMNSTPSMQTPTITKNLPDKNSKKK